MLGEFAGCLDVYSFTSYPDAFGDASVTVPDDYFSSIRKVLPNARIGISELGWSSAAPGSQEQQAEFIHRIPALAKGLGAEYVTLAELHDVPIFTGNQSRLNSVGLRTVDDVPKQAWDAVVRLPFTRHFFGLIFRQKERGRRFLACGLFLIRFYSNQSRT